MPLKALCVVRGSVGPCLGSRDILAVVLLREHVARDPRALTLLLVSLFGFSPAEAVFQFCVVALIARYSCRCLCVCSTRAFRVDASSLLGRSVTVCVLVQ